MSNYVYDDTHKRRGVALIIVNQDFKADTQQPKRDGAHNDMIRLSELFVKLNFQVRTFMDLTATEILKGVKKLAKEDHSDHDCLVVAISSHAQVVENKLREDYGIPDVEMWEAVDHIFGTDATVDMGEIVGAFSEKNCPSLKGKPKLFFVQGCRGENLSETVTVPARKEKQVSRAEGGSHRTTANASIPDLVRSTQHPDTVDAKVSSLAKYSPPTTVPNHWIQTNGEATMYEEDSRNIVEQMKEHRIDGPPKRDFEPMDLESEEPQNKVARQEPQTQNAESNHPNKFDIEEAQPPKEKIVSRKNIISRDCLITWSSPPGYYAFHTRSGSPFILALHDVLTEKHNEEDLLTMLTEVNYKVATGYESHTREQEFDKRHIVPSIEHMLLKEIYLKDKK